jgi:hypothetical protein
MVDPVKCETLWRSRAVSWIHNGAGTVAVVHEHHTLKQGTYLFLLTIFFNLVDGGDDNQIWWIAENILNKQSQTAYKIRFFSSVILRGGGNQFLALKTSVLLNITQGFGLGRFLWNDLKNGKLI